ncbi:MAG: hypothetical protein ACREFB_18325 [Stellaceae bacterium]
MAHIGLTYFNGWGVSQDPAQAKTWMQKAAANGDRFAANWLKSH